MGWRAHKSSRTGLCGSSLWSYPHLRTQAAQKQCVLDDVTGLIRIRARWRYDRSSGEGTWDCADEAAEARWSEQRERDGTGMIWNEARRITETAENRAKQGQQYKTKRTAGTGRVGIIRRDVAKVTARTGLAGMTRHGGDHSKKMGMTRRGQAHSGELEYHDIAKAPARK